MRPEPTGLRWDSSAEWLRSSVEDSLRALGIEHIDLYQVHWPDPRTPLAETIEALQGMVEQGKIRHVGVSNFDVAQIEQFAAVRPAGTLQPSYNLFHREIETKILPYCADHNIGVLVYGAARPQPAERSPPAWQRIPHLSYSTASRNLVTYTAGSSPRSAAGGSPACRRCARSW
jgi:diketogulonate reductase-like aldo/keto reductase